MRFTIRLDPRAYVSQAGATWALAAAASLISSRQLLIAHAGHYPLYLLLCQLLALAAWKIVTLPRTVANKARTQTATKTGAKSVIARALDTASYAISLPLLSKALLEFESTPLLCLLGLLVFAFPLLLSRVHGGLGIGLLARRLGLLVFALALMLVYEYRLTVEGLAYGLLAFGLFGLLQSLCGLLDQDGTQRAGLSSSLGLMVAIGATAVTALVFDDMHAALAWVRLLPRSTHCLLAVNVVTTVMTIKLGGYTMLFNTTADQISWTGLQRPSNIWPVLCTTGIVTLYTSHTRSSITHPLQLVCGLIAAGSVLDADFAYIFDRLRRRTVSPRERIDSLSMLLPREGAITTYHGTENGITRHDSMSENKDYTLDQPVPVQSTQSRSKGALVYLTIFFWIAASFSTMLFPAPPQHSVQSAILDYEYLAPSDFDIVLSSYGEPVESLAHTVRMLTSIPAIRDRNPRLFVYTKAYRQDLEAIRKALLPYHPNPAIMLSANLGREGETFLNHILAHWDTLGNHTAFLQADPHYPHHLATRIRNYYNSNTGMLPLGFSGQTCACDSTVCADRFWSDASGVMRDVFLHANRRETCDGDEEMLLSYKGQFVASAARIRGTDMGVYHKLRQWLIDPTSWVHTEPYLAGREDAMDNPVFGHALERLWAAVMQCNDPHVAKYCPSLMGGWRPGGSVRDCQCMDDTHPAFGRNETVAAHWEEMRQKVGPKLLLEE